PEFYTASRPFELKDSSAVWQLVVCNDEPMPNTDGKFWVDKAFELARKAPVADIMLASQPCLHWNRAQPVSRKPPMASPEHAKLLMVQTEFDLPTPLEGALLTFDALPAASMVYIRTEGRHGVLVHQPECVDLVVMDYLVGKPPARRSVECAGETLPFDAEPLADVKMRAMRVKEGPADNFRNAELAEELLKRLKEAAAL